MGRNSGFGAGFKPLDAFGKTMEDVKVKTGFGGLLTLMSLSLILSLTIYEFVDYRKVHMEPSIVVDRSRGEKLVVNLDVSFPRVPCYREQHAPPSPSQLLAADHLLLPVLSVDIMDISGEHQNDVNHDMSKTRLSKEGVMIEAPKGKELKGDLERIASQKGEGYCGTCYGGTPPESGCCNTCEEVREAYVRRGWSFVNPDSVEQCVSEGWSDKIKEQSEEGCNIAGKVRVNKVIGNFHLSPGRSFQANAMHVHDLVPYLQGGNKHDFGHVINHFSFGSEMEEEFVAMGGVSLEETKKSLGIVNPLDGMRAHTEESNYYEISPLMVIHREERQSFAHFLTSTCAIVGGVLTVAGLIDSFVYAGRNRLKQGGVKEGLGFARASGKHI
ncbi:endoplasmic reticulum-Golgi intermediate compartment protein 3, partial [Phenoliferia sp. Uapishka_3]